MGKTGFVAVAVACTALGMAAADGEALSVDWGKARKKVVAAGWAWGSMPFLSLIHI